MMDKSKIYQRLLSCEHARLPESVQNACLSTPVLSTEVLLSRHGLSLASPESLPELAEIAMVPKLGIKGWRDSESLGVLYEGVKIVPSLQFLLSVPTKQQLISARAWKETRSTLLLYLFPYKDFSDVSEVRFLSRPTGTDLISICYRGRSKEEVRSALTRMRELAVYVTGALNYGSWLVDVALLPDLQIGLVEINPALQAKELEVLLY